jgi:alkylated DNA repair protein (DNA oxidative demethylase)
MTATAPTPEAPAGSPDPSVPPLGFRYLPGYLDKAQQVRLASIVEAVSAEAPFFRPAMPKSGRPFSVEMTNAGRIGWISDRAGYRYCERHPQTGRRWPPIDGEILDIWHAVTGYPAPTECCLVNYYAPGARMGLHQDRDETDFAAPVVSISLGDSAVFRMGGRTRRGPTRSMTVHSGDVVILGGEARLAFHGIDRVLAGSSRLLPQGGRINLTLRRVSRPVA